MLKRVEYLCLSREYRVLVKLNVIVSTDNDK